MLSKKVFEGRFKKGTQQRYVGNAFLIHAKERSSFHCILLIADSIDAIAIPRLQDTSCDHPAWHRLAEVIVPSFTK
jgi:hypothetical protein